MQSCLSETDAVSLEVSLIFLLATLWEKNHKIGILLYISLKTTLKIFSREHFPCH